MKISNLVILQPMALAVFLFLSDLSLSIASSSESSFLRGNKNNDNIQSNDIEDSQRNAFRPNKAKTRGRLLQNIPPSPPVAPPGQWVTVGPAIEGDNINDSFGSSLATSKDGSLIAVGGPLNDGNGENAGHVKVFKYFVGSNMWIPVGEDIDGYFSSEYSGSIVDMSGDGDVVVVGSLRAQARVFRNIDGKWVQQGDFIPGFTVAISRDGKRVIVGGIFEQNIGLVRVFEYNEVDQAWLQLGGDINAPPDSINIHKINFGKTLDTNDDGNVIAVGNSPDLIHIYKYTNGQFVQQGQILPKMNGYDEFGWSLDLSGDGKKVIVGSAETGSAFVYRYNENNTWEQAGGVITGSYVTISDDGDIIVVGSNEVDNDAGHVRVFRLVEEQWVQQGQTLFGSSSAISPDGKRVVVGVPSQGYVQVYTFQDAPPAPTSTPTISPTHTPTAPTPTSTPTFAPTPVPTTSTPTSTPTPNPSSPPTSDVTLFAFCSDSPLMFMVQGIPRCCKWVARNPTERCDEMWGKGAGLDISIKTHCPETCQSCREVGCSDTVGRFTVDDHENIECCWLDSLSRSHKDELCFEDRIHSACPETCDICYDNYE